mmetsp:Transcript_735/g.1926  ORF Transcript_735/g.1926 Transcript_735/m.1926 type:complete len:236 (+) Transcript_735:1-708(+)
MAARGRAGHPVRGGDHPVPDAPRAWSAHLPHLGHRGGREARGCGRELRRGVHPGHVLLLLDQDHRERDTAEGGRRGLRRQPQREEGRGGAHADHEGRGVDPLREGLRPRQGLRAGRRARLADGGDDGHPEHPRHGHGGWVRPVLLRHPPSRAFGGLHAEGGGGRGQPGRGAAWRGRTRGFVQGPVERHDHLVRRSADGLDGPCWHLHPGGQGAIQGRVCRDAPGRPGDYRGNRAG